jgi:hypothetical protein
MRWRIFGSSWTRNPHVTNPHVTANSLYTPTLRDTLRDPQVRDPQVCILRIELTAPTYFVFYFFPS